MGQAPCRYRLEQLSIGVYLKPTCPLSWLQGFVERHADLRSVTFDCPGGFWNDNIDLPFAPQFTDAVENEGSTNAIMLNALTLLRPASSMPLKDWEVLELDLSIDASSGVYALSSASVLAPRLSSLLLQIPRFGYYSEAIHITPWIVSKRVTRQSKPAQTVSGCAEAHAAVRWFIDRIAQCSPAIGITHTSDWGEEHALGHLPHPWTLEASHQIGPNRLGGRDLEALGPPKLDMQECFCTPTKPAQTRKRGDAGVRSARRRKIGVK
ncbi:hypothetical protein B0H10DRAFT_1942811 [Mycena sp. CBHHK59/15]|nr:hypothetical protein B0H10DRAFT_1942811 [Mycena sp. CBHHK59/15]